MMALDPRIILAGQQPNIMASFDQGQQAGARQNAIGQQNALASLYQTQGAGIAAGDQNALNALAAIDPMASLGVQGQRQGMAATQQRMDMLSREEERQIQAQAASLSAAERAAEAQRVEQGVAQAMAAQTPEQWDAVVGRYDPSLVGQFENREMVAARYMSIADVLKRQEGGDVPATFAALDMQAKASGLEPGTPEYQEFMRNGGGDPATFRALDMQAQRAGYQPGTPEYQNFMATRGSGEQAFARTQGANEAEIASGGAAASAVESGKIAAERGAAAYDSYTKVVSSLSTIDEAIAAIDAGAQAGMTQKYLPNITLASASLENAMNRMGLDVISSVTFGALSEAEMTLAMDTAVPRDLSPPELKQWLTRKRDAQQKAADALLEAGRYLSKPGNTIESWIESKQGSGAQGGADMDFTQMSAADLAQVDVNSLTPVQMEAMMKRFDEVSQ